MQKIFNKNKMFVEISTRRKKAGGFSLIELVIVVVIIGILSAISLPYIYNYKKKYKSEDQALKVMDLMRETSQMALTRRRTIRMEIDLTSNAVLIIDENGANPDTQIKSIPLEPVSEVRVDQIPSGVTNPTPPTFPDAVFAVDSIGHQVGASNVIGHNVWAARFNSDGTVVNAANAPLSANLYFWASVTTASTTPRNKAEVRAITISGGSGSVRYWRHNGTTFLPN